MLRKEKPLVEHGLGSREDRPALGSVLSCPSERCAAKILHPLDLAPLLGKVRMGRNGRDRTDRLNFCHGIGLGLHERPIISRLNSFDDPLELEAGMMFAVEAYCPATDGISAPRIEEKVIVTPGGAARAPASYSAWHSKIQSR
jgi:Metallopeptidase family M24